jgi:hypothetical protein
MRNAKILITVAWIYAADVVLMSLHDGSPRIPHQGDYFLRRPTAAEALGCSAILLLPMVIVLGLVGYIKAAQFRRTHRLIADPRRCRKCDYILVAETPARCPECGTVPDKVIERRKVVRRESVTECVRIGIATLAMIGCLAAAAHGPRFPYSTSTYLSIAFLAWWFVHRMCERVIR